MHWITAWVTRLLILLKISKPATSFYWRNGTHNLCTVTVFIPESLRPRDCTSFGLFVIYFLIINSLHWLPWQMPHQVF